MEAIKINSRATDLKYVVNAFFESGTLSCFTCNTCTVECPVNKTVGKLDPRKIVRMAAFGMREELLGSVDIWLCMQCNKCSNICPQRVQPAAAIYYFRNLAVKDGFVSEQFSEINVEIDEYFQKLRGALYASALALAKEGKEIDVDKLVRETVETSKDVADIPYEAGETTVKVEKLLFGEFSETRFVQCLTCRECSVSCIVSRAIRGFDPVKIMRSYYLGIVDDMLASPDLWLCISCETCSEVCRQGVKGNVLISRLKNQAVEKGIIPPDAVESLAEIDGALHEIRFEVISNAWNRRKEIEEFDLRAAVKDALAG